MNIDISIGEIVSHLTHLAIAYILAFPIGWDRETRARSAGLRTFPLVAVGACAYMLVGLQVVGSGDAAARVMYGIITGIGFIGGGAILKDGATVTGTATAASIWNVGAIGVAVAWGRFEIAIVLSLMNFITLHYVRKLKTQLGKNQREEPLREE